VHRCIILENDRGGNNTAIGVLYTVRSFSFWKIIESGSYAFLLASGGSN